MERPTVLINMTCVCCKENYEFEAYQDEFIGTLTQPNKKIKLPGSTYMALISQKCSWCRNECVHGKHVED